MSKNEKDNLSAKIQINWSITVYSRIRENSDKIRDCEI